MERVDLRLQVTATRSLGEPWRYRTTAGISLGRHAGFRRQGSLAIVPIHDCPISHPLIGRTMATLNQCLAAEKLPNYRGRVRLDVRVVDGPLLQVVVRPSEDYIAGPAELDTLTSFLAGLESISSVSLASPDGEFIPIRGNPFGVMTVAGRPVTVHAASFFQTNVELLTELIERLRREVSAAGRPRIADVYGGVGIFGLFLADAAERVLVIESDPYAEEACRQTALAWGVDTVEFRTEEAEVALTDAEGLDLVVVDPPRTGLSASAIESLIEIGPSTILYVSCLAQSLARDLRLLTAEGYTVDALELFDFYPQTYHVEILAVLHRTGDDSEERTETAD
jgi:tRNA/tmRNA/rRNA uracil-C5-methylase (TrmA/RlmC/RlmD family)